MAPKKPRRSPEDNNNFASIVTLHHIDQLLQYPNCDTLIPVGNQIKGDLIREFEADGDSIEEAQAQGAEWAQKMSRIIPEAITNRVIMSRVALTNALRQLRNVQNPTRQAWDIQTLPELVNKNDFFSFQSHEFEAPNVDFLDGTITIQETIVYDLGDENPYEQSEDYENFIQEEYGYDDEEYSEELDDCDVYCLDAKWVLSPKNEADEIVMTSFTKLPMEIILKQKARYEYIRDENNKRYLREAPVYVENSIIKNGRSFEVSNWKWFAGRNAFVLSFPGSKLGQRSFVIDQVAPTKQEISMNGQLWATQNFHAKQQLQRRGRPVTRISQSATFHKDDTRTEVNFRFDGRGFLCSFQGDTFDAKTQEHLNERKGIGYILNK